MPVLQKRRGGLVGRDAVVIPGLESAEEDDLDARHSTTSLDLSGGSSSESSFDGRERPMTEKNDDGSSGDETEEFEAPHKQSSLMNTVLRKQSQELIRVGVRRVAVFVSRECNPQNNAFCRRLPAGSQAQKTRTAIMRLIP